MGLYYEIIITFHIPIEVKKYYKMSRFNRMENIV
jgi:hypothetical protein